MLAVEGNKLEERTFKGICLRFCHSLAWCGILGFVLGLLYRFDLPLLQNEILGVIRENSAPKSFNLIAVISIFSLSLVIIFAGRTKSSISQWRNIFAYKSAEVALSLAAVFFGLLTGFSISVRELPLLVATLIVFIFTVVVQLFLLWLSFEGNFTKNELAAKLSSFSLCITTVLVFYCVYAG